MKYRRFVPWTAAGVAVAGLAMALPAQAQQKAPAPGSFLGAVLISDDARAASEFYKALFGWDMEQAEDGGYAVRHKGRMIAGISPLKESNKEVEESFWLVGLTVGDLDAALKSAREDGAKIYDDSRRNNDYGRFEVIADRQKAAVLLIEPGYKPLGRTSGPGS
ncbi:MAG: VOC family protein, partial [Acidobacteriota bacterium]